MFKPTSEGKPWLLQRAMSKQTNFEAVRSKAKQIRKEIMYILSRQKLPGATSVNVNRDYPRHTFQLTSKYVCPLHLLQRRVVTYTSAVRKRINGIRSFIQILQYFRIRLDKLPEKYYKYFDFLFSTTIITKINIQ